MKTISDQMSYNLLIGQQPGLVAVIRRSLELGVTADSIEATVFNAAGENSLMALVIGGAAHWLENNREAGRP